MKNPFGNLKFPVLAAAAILCIGACNAAAPACAQELTPAESQKLRYCEAGIAELNPEIAAECLNEKFLLDKLAAQSSTKGLKLIQLANALKDMYDLAEMHTEPEDLRVALAVRFEPGMPAAELGLGPEPEKYLEWAVKYKPEKEAVIKKAIRSWSALEEDEKAWLTSRGITTSKWSGLWLKARTTALYPFIISSARELLKTPSEIAADTIAAMAQKAKSLWRDIPPEMNIELSTHFGKLRTRLAAADEADKLLKPNLAKLKNFHAGLESVKNLPVTEQLEYLNRFFENSPVLSKSGLAGNANHAGAGVRIDKFSDSDSRVIAELLKPALFAEIAGTVSGDRVADFFKQKENVLKIEIVPAAGVFGRFDTKAGKLFFSENAIQTWMVISGHSKADIMTNPEALRALALLLSPVFVHEATHQRQAAWFRSKMLSPVFSQDSEIEAASAEALYIIEKVGKSREFAKMLSEKNWIWSAEKSRRGKEFQENPRLFRRNLQCQNYAQVPSFEAAAAGYLSAADMISEELKWRKQLPQKQQDYLEKEGIEYSGEMPLEQVLSNVKTSTLEKLMLHLGSWYSENLSRTEEHLQWADKTLKELTSNDNPVKKTARKSPPKP